MPDYIDDDIERAEARLAQLREDKARREADQRERAAAQSYSDVRDDVRQQEADRVSYGFVQKFNSAPLDAYGQRMGISPREVETFTNHRFVTHVRRELAFWNRLQSRPYEEIIGGSQ